MSTDGDTPSKKTSSRMPMPSLNQLAASMSPTNGTFNTNSNNNTSNAATTNLTDLLLQSYVLLPTPRRTLQQTRNILWKSIPRTVLALDR
ncbi:hypothetical protein F5879DRAFT_908086 [Lentinula edodes]|nr:hypothetical protein F5879DRAFT_908086 [Lentinula edodes]